MKTAHDQWFFNELNVFSHINDLTNIEAFSVPLDTLLWMCTKADSSSKPLCLKLMAFSSTSCIEQEFSEKDFNTLLPSITPFFHQLSINELWMCFFQPLISVFPHSIHETMLRILTERSNHDSTLEVPFEMMSWLVEMKPTTDKKLSRKLFHQVPNVRSLVYKHLSNAQQEMVDGNGSDEDLQGMLVKFKIYFQFLTIHQIWNCFLHPLSTVNPSVIHNYLTSELSLRLKQNSAVSLNYKMVSWLMIQPSFDASLMILFLKNVPSIDNQLPFVLPEDRIHQMLSICDCPFVFIGLVRSSVSYLQSSEVDSEEMCQLLLSSSFAEKMKMFTVCTVRSRILPLFSSCNEDFLIKFQAKVILPIFLNPPQISSEAQHPQLVTEEIVIDSPVVKQSGKTNSKEQKLESFKVRVNYSTMTEWYVDEPKLEGAYSALLMNWPSDPNVYGVWLPTTPKGSNPSYNYISSLFYSWITGAEDPLKVFVTDLSRSDAPHWNVISGFAYGQRCDDFYHFCGFCCLENYLDSFDCLIDQALTCVRTTDPEQKYNFFESCLRFFFDKGQDNKLSLVLEAMAKYIDPTTNPMPWFWKDFIQMKDIRPFTRAILDKNEDYLRDALYSVIVQPGYSTGKTQQSLVASMFPHLSLQRKKQLVGIVIDSLKQEVQGGREVFFKISILQHFSLIY
ncbi:hypothetical protein GEMRC1_000442 [Eukaryota sp. GEM-RC1]